MKDQEEELAITDVIDPTEADVQERILVAAERLFREIGYQMRFAGRQCEAHRQSIGIDDGMNLTRQPTARPARADAP
jgi:hypothetical protein